jgi:hypothetical protein
MHIPNKIRKDIGNKKGGVILKQTQEQARNTMARKGKREEVTAEYLGSPASYKSGEFGRL